MKPCNRRQDARTSTKTYPTKSSADEQVDSIAATASCADIFDFGNVELVRESVAGGQPHRAIVADLFCEDAMVTSEFERRQEHADQACSCVGQAEIAIEVRFVCVF